MLESLGSVRFRFVTILVILGGNADAGAGETGHCVGGSLGKVQSEARLLVGVVPLGVAPAQACCRDAETSLAAGH